MKRRTDIEKLLTWAFAEELPKRELSAAEANWENISQQGARGGVGIDTTPQRYAAISAPHPDAVTIEREIGTLPRLLEGNDAAAERVSIDYASSREALFGDMPLLAPASLQLPDFNIVVMVRSMAILRSRPRWNIGRPQPNRVLAANGRPVVVGLDGAKRYRLNAHCPLSWSPSMPQIAEARAEYLLWHFALTKFAVALRDSLHAHVPEPPAALMRPWVDARNEGGQVLPNLLARTEVLSAIEQRRKRGHSGRA